MRYSVKNPLKWIVLWLATLLLSVPTAFALCPTSKAKRFESPKNAAESTVCAEGEPFLSSTEQDEWKIYRRPVGTSKPVFLRDTLNIDLRAKNTYWKFPNQNNYTSWVPRVDFEAIYNDSAKLRYTAEWFNADGSPWFTEALRYVFTGIQTAHISSEYSDETQGKAVVTTGTYGLKITNSKTNEVVFQGKFKVRKMPFAPGDASLKNRFEFFVDNDWNLPIGYVGFKYDTPWDYPQPIAFMWFKGRLKAEDFEARLILNGQEIASTDEGGYITTSPQERGSDCLKFVDTCMLQQWEFYWKNFIVENTDWLRSRKPESIFTKDKPGEYTVKVFHKSVQVREVKFTIDTKGEIARNAFSDQMPLSNYKIVVPVKILGTLDKWNPATAKVDAFYGNPLPGFGGP